MLLWIEKVWESRPGQLLRKKSCLVYDMFKTRIPSRAGFKKETQIIPGGLTSQLQPLDVSINKDLWSDWMAGSTDHALTRRGRLKRPSITLWCQWVLKAWNDIDPAIIIKSFKKC